MFYQDCLINEKYLKMYSILPKNFDTSEVANYVKIAEEIWIMPIIGEALYTDILKQIKDGDISPEYQTLLLNLYSYEGMCVCLEALPFICYRATETGIVKQKTDTTESIDTKELSYLQQTLRSSIEVRKEQFRKWMNEHADSFPLYAPDCCDCSCSCGTNGKLKSPEPLTTIYRPKKINTDLK